MPSQPPSDKSGWRGGAKSQTWREPTQQKGWTKKRDRQYEHAVYRHRVWLAVSTLVLITLVGTLIYYLMRRWVRTPFLCVAVTEYNAPLPPNAWAAEDLERFGELERDDEVLDLTKFEWGRGDQRLDDLRTELLAATPGGPGSNVIIIYLSMHGAVDGQNEPCLLPRGASPANPDNWLRVSQVLKCLKERKDVKKLLILDANRMDINWGLGLLANGFADRLEEVVENNKDPDLVVLNSTSPGELGWAAPELAGSVFGHCLWRGLKGQADANTDDRVSVRELHRYLRQRVADWTVAHRDDAQTPMLIMPDGMDDFAVVHTKRPEIEEPESAMGSLPQEITNLWEEHQRLLRSADPYRLSPLKWEEYQYMLLRLEQLALAGPTYEQQAHAVRSQVVSLAGEIEGAAVRRDLAAYSLPMAKLSRPWDDRETEDATMALHMALRPPAAAEPSADAGEEDSAEGSPAETAVDDAASDDPEEAAAEGGGPTDETAEPRQPARTPTEDLVFGRMAAAEAVWVWAIADAGNPDDLATAIDFANQAGPRRESDLIELLLLWMLQKHLDAQVWDREPQTGHIKAALETRRLADAAAVPRDERAQYWIRDLVDRLDTSRRAAEDRLFIGGDAELRAASRLWEDLGGQGDPDSGYPAAIRTAAEVADAFRTRDEALAKTPHLAEWVLSRLRATRADDTTAAESLSLLIVHGRRLAELLDDSLTSGELPSNLLETQQAVRRDLDGLLSEFDKWVELETAGGDAATLRRIATVLATPLTTGEKRRRLWQRYVGIARSIPSGFQDLGDDDSARNQSQRTAATGSSAYLESLNRGGWPEHPALTILRLAGHEGTAVLPPRPVEPWSMQRLATEGQELRGLLYGGLGSRDLAEGPVAEGVYDRAGAWLKETREAIAGSDSPVAVRATCSMADRIVRASAAVLGSWAWPYEEPDPACQLRDFDLHHLMLWHAERAMEDFWGPTSSDLRPFFEIAAEGYLKSASGLCPDSARCDTVERRLRQRKIAAEQAVQPTVPRRPVDRSEDLIDHSATVASREGLPQGEAAFYLQESAQPEYPLLLSHDGNTLYRLPVGVPAGDGQAIRYRIRAEDVENVTGLRAVALYRGHVRDCPCSFPPDEGWDIEYIPAGDYTPRITVSGGFGERNSVVFILDCSGSMGLRVGGAAANPRRIDVARAELKHILDVLVEGSQARRVGVMVYSRRAAWGEGPNGDIIIVPRVEEQIHPCADVEWLFEPDRLTEREKRQVFDQLDNPLTQPGGSTPLYLAIIKAMREFRSEEERRHIVVITDGMNNQIASVPIPRQVGGIRAQQEISDLTEVLGADPNVRLDVIGFELDPDGMSAKERSDYRLFRELLKERFYHTANSAELRKAIFGAMAPPQYEVLSLPGRERAADAVDLGATTRIEKGGKGDYAIGLADPKHSVETEVELEGDEWLRLRLSDDWRQLLFEHLGEPDDRRGSPILVAGAPGAAEGERFVIQAHRPHREDATIARFDVSMWNEREEKFTLRPKEIWMEVTPLRGAAGPDAVRVFFDRSFKPEYPVPRLTCVAGNWPIDANAAEIQVWLKYDDTEGATSKPLDELLGRDAQSDPLRIAGVEFKAEIRAPQRPTDPCEVEIKEKHPPDGPLQYVKVEMAPAPQAITRHYSPQTRTVRHSFTYQGVNPDHVKLYTVRFTTEEELKERTISLPKPLVVDVPPPGR